MIRWLVLAAALVVFAVGAAVWADEPEHDPYPSHWSVS